MSPFYALAPIILAILGPQHGCSYLREWMDSAVDEVKRHAPRNCVPVNMPAGDGDGRYALCLVDLDEDETDRKSGKLEWSPEALANVISSGSAELLFASGDMRAVFGRVEYWLGLAWGTLGGLMTAWLVGRCCSGRSSRRADDDESVRRVYYPVEEERVEVPVEAPRSRKEKLTISVETPMTDSTAAETPSPVAATDGVVEQEREEKGAYQRKVPDLRFNEPVYRGRPKDLPEPPTTPSSSSPVSSLPESEEATRSPAGSSTPDEATTELSIPTEADTPTSGSASSPSASPSSPEEGGESAAAPAVATATTENFEAPNATVSPASAVVPEGRAAAAASPQQQHPPTDKSKRHRPPKPERQRLAALRKQEREEEAARKAAAEVAQEEAA
ncbi:hypothetical protein FOZ60_008134 [Perkinsus olseni]|uniref:Uncharacterized protein n=1 Tax=Perkinsus olseni TaxID=32597 RepID=A0A7J6NL21_PEROL|nr:hypothetical protein FOZ60_008134 [Perkinsus olseni]